MNKDDREGSDKILCELGFIPKNKNGKPIKTITLVANNGFISTPIKGDK